MPWTTTVGPTSEPDAKVIRIYQSPDVITLDEMNARPPRTGRIRLLEGQGMELQGRGRRGGTVSVHASADPMSVPVARPQIGTSACPGGVFTFVDTAGTNEAGRIYHLQQ